MRNKWAGYAGTVIVTDQETGQATTHGTHMCVHCGRHFIPDPKISHWCGQCAGHVCHSDCTQACVPMEQMLENIEHGRPLGFRPAVVSFAQVGGQ
jgi:hypothetical protein